MNEIWDDGSKACLRYKAYVESERKRMTKSGEFKLFMQEFYSLFTVTQTSFFEHKDIDDGVKDTPQMYEYKETPSAVGYDYGMTKARTVITIRAMIKGEIIQIFQHRCPANFDINKLTDPEWEHSIQSLKRRYNLFMIIPDDCPQGDSTNRWFEKNSGIEVYKYNFRSDQMSKKDGVNRNCLAYSYRIKLKVGILKIPKWNDVQQFEMKIIQETEQKILISIKAPEGQLCDTFDSDMMACLPFLDMKDVRDFSFDSSIEQSKEEMSHEDKFNRNRYDYFHSPTDDECRKMIEQANNGEL